MSAAPAPDGEQTRRSRWPLVTAVVMVALAALLIAAHFLRAMNMPMVALSLAAPLLLLWRRRWSLIVVQLLAYLAAARWIATAIELIDLREQMGRPWTTTAIILGSVALFTVVSGLLLNGRAVRGRYRA